MSFLYQIVEFLLEDCGFSTDLYMIRENGDDVIVEVDDKEAADYIMKIAEEPQYVQRMACRYSRNGKRHKITFFLW